MREEKTYEKLWKLQNALKRGDFSYKKYGSYARPIECCLIENEVMPWRKKEDTCDKYEEREEKENENR